MCTLQPTGSCSTRSQVRRILPKTTPSDTSCMIFLHHWHVTVEMNDIRQLMTVKYLAQKPWISWFIWMLIDNKIKHTNHDTSTFLLFPKNPFAFSKCPRFKLIELHWTCLKNCCKGICFIKCCYNDHFHSLQLSANALAGSSVYHCLSLPGVGFSPKFQRWHQHWF